MRPLAVLLLLSPALFAQSEGALQRAFEGKRVRVKIDMPATHEGIDCYAGREQPLDFKSYTTRLRRFGAALRDGDEVMVTGVKVKKKNIEFQLGGGGYGVLGDDTGYVSARSVPKTEREKQLERDIRNERDPDRRKHLERELSRIRDRREREEREERDIARRETEANQREIAEKRLQAGSRFNIWFQEGYLKESVPTPEEVMRILSEWVEFPRSIRSR